MLQKTMLQKTNKGFPSIRAKTKTVGGLMGFMGNERICQKIYSLANYNFIALSLPTPDHL